MEFGDFSHWNNNRADGALDYAGYCKTHDVSIIKAIDGTSVDPYFRTNRAGFHAAGIKRLGIYAYAEPGNSAINQARAFIELVGKLSPNEFPILDLEDNAIPIETYNTFAEQWDITIKSFYRIARTTLYAGDGKVGYVTHPMNRWVARYASSEPMHPFDAWQFTSTANLPGMGAPNDYSTFNGTLELFDSVFLPWVNHAQKEDIDMSKDELVQTLRELGVLTKSDLPAIGDSIITNFGDRAYNTVEGKGKASDQIQRIDNWLITRMKAVIGK